MKRRVPIKAHIQGRQNRTHGPFDYMFYQDLIFDVSGVSATVVLKGGMISLRTKDYADFILAKNALKGKATHPIIRDVFHD